jgi:hypothetical protein
VEIADLGFSEQQWTSEGNAIQSGALAGS